MKLSCFGIEPDIIESATEFDIALLVHSIHTSLSTEMEALCPLLEVIVLVGLLSAPYQSPEGKDVRSESLYICRSHA